MRLAPRLSEGYGTEGMEGIYNVTPVHRREDNVASIMELLTDQSPAHTLSLISSIVRAKWKMRNATSIGKYVKLIGKIRVANRGRLIVGDRVLFNSYLYASQLVVHEGAELIIGKGAFINYGADFCALKRISIGEECRIGTHCIIIDSDFHSIEVERRDEKPSPEEVVLEPHTWVGNRVTILKGVRVGYGSVIAAGSVVNKSIPPMSVAGGVPARVIQRIGQSKVRGGS